MSYPFSKIEKKWQEYWEKNQTYKTPENQDKPKYYILDMFPYPSGAGLHVGHPEGYTATDILARYKRKKGFNVLHPMGWDAFGLPAERYAMKTGIHPKDTTEQNVDNFRTQLKSLGFSYDWQREISTTNEKYYKWTQWIFLKIFHSWFDEKKQKAMPIESLPIPKDIQNDEQRKEDYINSKRLAYITDAPVNWCPELGTVLANEEVEEWTQKGYEVVRKPLRQWMLRITAYAQRLLDDLEGLDWPAGTLEIQKNWIGRSQGAQINFRLAGHDDILDVFTTRPDTLFGVTYMVLAPEHPLVHQITTKEYEKKVLQYVETTSRKSERERMVGDEQKQKTGCFTGAMAVHPLTNELIPIWIADYVLLSYGSGAVMAVPAHDERDFEFARHYNLPVKVVVCKKKNAATNDPKEAFTGDGFNVNSEILDGLATKDAKLKIIKYLKDHKLGTKKINFKLRDWLFSRQRYWGEPIPVSFTRDGHYKAMKTDQLPLKLPQTNDFHPARTGESPLARLDDWIEYQENGETLKRESNTMPQWAGSCWYYLRFIDPDNTREFVDPEKEKYWMGDNGVDLYVGGAEHAVLHLLYARFWHKILYDLDVVSTNEPFNKLVHQGLILGEDGEKMSKSLGNVVNPDDVVGEHGADAFRLYEMFLGPLEQKKPWSTKGIEGTVRFLNRVWRLYTQAENEDTLDGIDPRLLLDIPEDELANAQRVIHFTIKKVSEDIEKLSFNTAISQMMIFVNEFYNKKQMGRQAASDFIQLLYPFAPHIAEELWNRLGNTKSLTEITWPAYDESKIKSDQIEVVFQVNGKLRGRSTVPANISEEELQEIALADAGVIRARNDKAIRKIIVIKKKLVNIVV